MRLPPIGRLALQLAKLSITDTHYLYERGVITKEVLQDAVQAQNAAKQKPKELSPRRKNAPKKSRR